MSRVSLFRMWLCLSICRWRTNFGAWCESWQLGHWMCLIFVSQSTKTSCMLYDSRWRIQPHVSTPICTARMQYVFSDQMTVIYCLWFIDCRVHIIAPECCWWRNAHVQVDFFVGHPACNMRLQGDTVGALRRKVERLLGINENGPPNPPWVNCCLMSYWLDKERPRESRRYRIFGTRFPG